MVQVIRKLAETRRVGHAGTLDPAATGVLGVAIGRATRLIDYMAESDKSYCADVVLGAATDTDDFDGRVLDARDPFATTLAEVVSALSGFLGNIQQVPPQYSAVKLQGRKAYEIARSGKKAEISPRQITIRGIAVVGWEPPVLSLLVRCSKGTYIRGLARDLGERLGVGAHLGALVRLSSGPFHIDDASSIDDLKLAAEMGYLEDLLWPADSAVFHRRATVVTRRVAGDMLGGRKWQAGDTPAPDETVRVYSEDGQFLGLAGLESGIYHPRLVLAGRD